MKSEPESIVSSLDKAAADFPERIACSFFDDKQEVGLSYNELNLRAKTIAARIQEFAKPGERVILIYPPGIEFISAFFACLYAGVIAIPVYPPKNEELVLNLQKIIEKAEPVLCLSTKDVWNKIKKLSLAKRIQSLPLLDKIVRKFSSDNLNNLMKLSRWDFDRFKWITSDTLITREQGSWQPVIIRPDHIAMLQYTSGSSGHPKGVMLSHKNIMHNLQLNHRDTEVTQDDCGVSWLPLYHNIGLIICLLQPIYSRFPTHFMSPLAFLERPSRWLQAISHYRATVSGAPSFAYDLSVRHIDEDIKKSLDLSSWDLAFCGGEPVRPAILDRFYQAFRACGLKETIFFPAYGLTESTVYVLGSKRGKGINSLYVDKKALSNGKIVVHDHENAASQVLTGYSWHSQTLKIVDPQTNCISQDNIPGEIWLSSLSVASGYWEDSAATERSFHNYLATGEGPFLRTGDLGFIRDNLLYITGRLKDLIIIRGKNYYPHDLEEQVNKAHPLIRLNHSIAFSVDEKDAEKLIILVEIKTVSTEQAQELCFAIAGILAESYGIRPDCIALLPENSFKKTSNAKIRRSVIREDYIEDRLPILFRWDGDIRDELPNENRVDDNPPSKDTLQDWIRNWISTRMSYEVSRINCKEKLTSLGLDSLGLMQLCQSIEEKWQLAVHPNLVFDYPSIDSLAEYLASVKQQEVKVVDSESYDQSVKDSRFDDQPIAIIGMSCRFPQANTIHAFWELLKNNKEAISTLPPDRWRLGSEGLRNQLGGFLEQIDYFDADFFSLSRREAELIDPQHRLLLEVTWEALMAAGIKPESLAGSPSSVFVGISNNDYGQLLRPLFDGSDGIYLSTGNALSAAAGRIAYHFALRGQAVSLDTACSSSLVAVHHACQDLRNKRSKLAIAAGVNLILSSELSQSFASANMLSPDGRCKTFDASADGYVRSEGCAAIILKPLEDALRDNNPVLAVIPGSAVNHDGASNGFTAPSGQAQLELLQQALKVSGLQAQDLDYIEAHGTGTALGDPLEIGAIASLFKQSNSNSKPLVIGSVKTNIGHLEAAAGIAGLIKVVLALQHQSIPANLHFNQSNPLIDLTAIPAVVPRENLPWKKNPRLRRAGVSAFGFTGTNAHIIVEESPSTLEPIPRTQSPFKRQSYWAPHLSGSQRHPLQAYFYSVEWLEKTPAVLIPLIALQDQLQRRGERLQDSLVSYPALAGVLNHLCFASVCNAFTCLGWKNEPGTRWALKELAEGMGVTANYQRLFSALLKLLSTQDLLQAEPQGYLINADLPRFNLESEYQNALAAMPEHALEIQFLNSCTQNLPYILAGKLDPLSILFSQQSESNVMDVYYHSHLSISYNQLLATAVEGILRQWPKDKPLRILEVGAGTGSASAVILPLLGDHLVEFTYTDISSQFFIAAKAKWIDYSFIQYKVLNIENDPVQQGFSANHYDLVIAANVLHACADLQLVLVQIKKLLASNGLMLLLENTQDQDWLTLTFGLLEGWWRFEDTELRQDSPLLSAKGWKDLLLSQGFGEVEYYSDPISAQQAVIMALNTTTIVNPQDNHCLEEEFWLCFTEEAGTELNESLSAVAGRTILTVIPGDQFSQFDATTWTVNYKDADDYIRLLQSISSKPVKGILFFWGFSAQQLSQEFICGSALYLIQAIIKLNLSLPLYIVHSGVQSVQCEVPQAFACSSIWGLVNVATVEHPELLCRCLDLDPQYSPRQGMTVLMEELNRTDKEQFVVWRSSNRYVSRLQALDPLPVQPELALKGDRSYLITGGLSGIGLELVEWFINKGAKNLILLGRSAPNENTIKKLESLSNPTILLKIVQADVSDYEQLAQIFNEIEQTMPALAGIIHSAGVVEDASLLQQSWSQFELVFAAKVYGAWNLHRLSTQYSLDHFILFSSMATLLGSPGQSNHAAANAYLDALAAYRNALGMPVCSINWGLWKSIGYASDHVDHQQMQDRGMNWIEPCEGLAACDIALSQQWTQFGFANIDWSKLQKTVLSDKLFLDQLIDKKPSDPAKQPFSAANNPLTLDLEPGDLKNRIRELVASILNAPSQDLDLKKGFVDLGMDSLMALDLRNRLQERMGKDYLLPATLIYDYPNISSLADFIYQELHGSSIKEVIQPGEKSTVLSNDDIAIIGMSCRFPGSANSPEDLWDLLVKGQDAITEFPQREGVVYDNSGPQWGGFINDIDLFDGDFFGISPRELKYLDPQQRLLLEVSWETLERAGIAAEQLRGSATGVYIGICGNDYSNLIRQQNKKSSDIYIPTGNALSTASGRLSYVLGLQGPSLSIDTACSSSLVAIHLAVQSLRRGECDLALAGGVNLILQSEHSLNLVNGNMLSPDGRCKTFDAEANGFVRSEGCAVVAVKRLADALVGGYPVLAVIKGTAINQDGASAGLTAPNVTAQEALISMALDDAKLSAHEIDYLEAHGTGTLLGDPIELDALNVLSSGRTKPVLLGSIKSNMGHAEAASGIAGLVKTVLALQYGFIPANLHFNRLNPNIRLEKIPAQVVTTTTAWPSVGGRKRYAGVSSFGFSGTNAHIILEEAPAATDDNTMQAEPGSQQLVLSAKTEQSLQELIKKYLQFLAQTPYELVDIAYTALIGRNQYPHNVLVEGQTISEMIVKLEQGDYLTGVQQDSPIERQGKRRVVLPTYCFKKQRHWIETETGPAALFVRSEHPLLGRLIPTPLNQTLFTQELDLSSLAYLSDHVIFQQTIFPGAGYVELILSAARQILGSSSMRMQAFRIDSPLLLDLGKPVKIQVILGKNADHSFNLAVYSQNQLNNEWLCHATALVNPVEGNGLPLDQSSVETRYPQQARIADFYQGIEAYGILYGSSFQNIRQLNYGESEAFAIIEFAQSTDPYLCHPALLDSCFQVLVATCFFKTPEQESIYLPLSIDELTIYKPLGNNIQVSAQLGSKPGNDRIVADLQLYNAQGELLAAIKGLQGKRASQNALRNVIRTVSQMDTIHYGSQWIKSDSLQKEPVIENELWVILAGHLELAQQFRQQQGQVGIHSIQVVWADSFVCYTDFEYGINPRSEKDFSQLFETLPRIGKVIYLAENEEQEAVPELALSQTILLMTLYKSLQTSQQDSTSCYLVTHGALPAESGTINLTQSALSGFYKSGFFELTSIKSHHIDLDPKAGTVENFLSLYRELRCSDDELQVAYRHQQRFVNRLARQERSASNYSVSASGSYLITGGLGGIGLKLAEQLVTLGAKHLVLTSRSLPNDETVSRINQMENQGVRIEIVQSDVGDLNQVQTLMARFGREWPPLRGIVHAAGVLNDGTLLNQSATSIKTVFLPKVYGAWNLHLCSLQGNISLDFFILFSSIASVLGSPGQSNYAAANSFLDALAHYRSDRGLVATSINWGTWDTAGMAVAMQRRHQSFGIEPLTDISALTQILGSGHTQPIIAKINWQNYLNQLPSVPSWLQGFNFAKNKQFDLITQLEQTPPAMKMKALRQFLRRLVAEVMEFTEHEKVPDTKGFFELGLDSLMAVDLHKKLQLAIGDRISLSTTLLFDYPSIEALTTQLASLLSIQTELITEKDRPDYEEMSLNELINLIDD